MNIEKLFTNFLTQKTVDKIYAKSFSRAVAGGIDITIVLFLRIFTAQILGLLFVNLEIQKFLAEFKEKFGTDFVKNNADHISFVTHHRIFLIALFFYATVIFVGALYHALLNSSAWQATIGKRIMNIVIIKENGSTLGFNKALMHYFLSVMPFVFIMYLLGYQIQHNINFYQTVTASWLNIFLGIIFLLWTQIQIISKRKTTAYDLICKTFLINRRNAAKFPWSKEKISNFL
ncbi:MAG: RDD family protein [Rickettsiales bacterium]|nr:RDD family protein [Rickettsiales bacterium]